MREIVDVFGGPSNAVSVLVDDPETADELVMAGVDPRVLTVHDVEGNSESFAAMLEDVLRDDPTVPVYLVEDDYRHSRDAAALILEGLTLNPDGYVTLYDDPLFYHASADVAEVSSPVQVELGPTRHWCVTPSTTMTFAAHPWVLRRDRDLILASLSLGRVPADRKMWEALATRSRLIRSIPGGSSHSETTAAAAFVSHPSWFPPAAVGDQSLWWRTALETGPILVSASASPVVSGAMIAAGYSFKCTSLAIEQSEELSTYAVVMVDAHEKDNFDRGQRARATRVQTVVVCGDITICGRWFGGRDLPADILLEHLNAP